MEKVPLHDEDTRQTRAPSAPPIEHVTPLQQSAADPGQNPPRTAPMYPQMPVEEQPSSSQHQQGWTSMPPPPAYDAALAMPQQAPQAGAEWSSQTNGAGFPPIPMPTQLPQPPPEVHHVQQPTTIIVTNGFVPGRCEHCSGPLEMHRDTAMLLFIILCLVFCCPIGIFLLCCVPCTNQRRCAVCHRPG